MRRLLAISGVALISVVALVVLANVVRVGSHISSVIKSDPRNEGISVWAYYTYGIPSDSIVFDLRNISLDSSQADVTRVLLQFAYRMKDRRFDQVYLAWRGERKFILDGEYFNLIGREYEHQNPIYTIRTMPENIKRMDGSVAYSKWTGGWLGVLGRQLEDVNQFHRDWYLSDRLSTDNRPN